MYLETSVFTPGRGASAQDNADKETMPICWPLANKGPPKPP